MAFQKMKLGKHHPLSVVCISVSMVAGSRRAKMSDTFSSLSGQVLFQRHMLAHTYQSHNWYSQSCHQLVFISNLDMTFPDFRLSLFLNSCCYFVLPWISSSSLQFPWLLFQFFTFGSFFFGKCISNDLSFGMVMA